MPVGIESINKRRRIAVTRRLAHRDVDAAIGEHRRRNDGAARKDTCARQPASVFWIAIKAPELFTRRSVVDAQPTIATAEEYLKAPIDVGSHRAGPRAVQHLVSWSNGAPHQLARVLVHCYQTRSARRWNTCMAFVLTVGCTDEQQITQR